MCGSSVKPYLSSSCQNPCSSWRTSWRSCSSTVGTSSVDTVSSTTRSCSTLLWIRLWSSAGGVALAVPYMYTAVPGTRCGGLFLTSRMKSSMGSVRDCRRLPRIWRPFFHVVITANITAAITSGNQPPCGILTMLAPQNARSTTRNAAESSPTRSRLHFQRERATNAKRIVVNTMSVVTATPYAAASRLDDWKPTTRLMHAIISAQFTAGM